ncbi:MAG TPA: DNA replication and repair protein RecF [Blastocatellia bacterium]|nr:DNA replication and repair protein RecF [Blastocatellia bacterium]
MILSSIEALGFRNLKGSLTCDAGLNILYGDNGQGKTNWLEAIYILGATKSFRTNHLDETINHNETTAILRAEIYQGTVRKELQAQIEKSAKAFYVNGKRESLVRYLGNLDVFAFTNDELEIVRGEPAERRRFLDRGIAVTRPAYIQTLNSYNRVLKQKVALLKSAQESEDFKNFVPLIEPWNEQLIDLGSEIHKSRTEYVEKLSRTLNPALFGKETLSIRYKSSLESHGALDNYAALFRSRLEARMTNEISLGYSLVGPHRDDLEISLDGREASRFGSSGQQRSALLILVLAQVSLYNEVFDDYPIFLLDDIDAELDLGRIRTVLNHLSGKTQTFISTSKRSITGWFTGPTAFRLIESGRATEVSPDQLGLTDPLSPSMTSDLVEGNPEEERSAVELNEVDPHQAPF